MSDIAPIAGVGVGGPGDRFDTAPTPGARPANGPIEVPARPSDRVDLSDRARLLNKLAALPDIRQGVVDAARRAIAAGAYESDEVLDTTIDGLAQDLRDL